MPIKKRSGSIFVSLALAIFLFCGNIFLTSPRPVFGFTFAVMSDPQWSSDSWINSLTETRDMDINPDPKFSRAEFILVAGDTDPIDLKYEYFNEIFKDSNNKPIFLPVIGNHEFDDSGGIPGGMLMVQGSQAQGAGGPPGQERQQGEGLPQGMQGSQGAGGPPGGMPQMPGNPPGLNVEKGDPAIIDFEFIRDKIISAIPGVVRLSDKSCSYYYDYNNVRVISIDGYSGEIGRQGVINEKGREWAEDVIKSAPENIEHIFIAFHAPAFPRVRHTQDSFSADPEQRNAFWNMLVSHRDKVRAVFVGHTHSYCRMRVLDPAGSAANDFSAYPDEEGGIYQINDGSTGNGTKNTFVLVNVEGKNIYFRVLESENGKGQPFTVKDEWSIKGK